MAITAGQTTASFSLTGLLAGSGNHTVSVTGAGYNPASTTSTAPFAIARVSTLSCTTVAAGLHQVRFNPQYTGLTGGPVTFSVVNELSPTTNPGPYSLNLYTDNPIVTLSAQQGYLQSTSRYNWIEACNAGPDSSTGTSSFVVSATYTAPISCSVAPPTPPVVALAVSAGTCQSATNTYTLTGTLSLTNATAASLTIADGAATTTVAITAGQATASFSLTGMLAGSGNHTVNVTGAGYSPTSATYSAPASCSVALPTPPPGLALAVSAGTCQSATNTYTLTGTLSLTNATAASLTIVDGSATTTVAITAGQTTASFSLTGMLAGSGSSAL